MKEKRRRSIDELAAGIVEALDLIGSTAKQLNEIVEGMTVILKKMEEEKDEFINSPHVASVLELVEVKKDHMK